MYIPLDRIVKIEKNTKPSGAKDCELKVYWFDGVSVQVIIIKGDDTDSASQTLKV